MPCTPPSPWRRPTRPAPLAVLCAVLVTTAACTTGTPGEDAGSGTGTSVSATPSGSPTSDDRLDGVDPTRAAQPGDGATTDPGTGTGGAGGGGTDAGTPGGTPGGATGTATVPVTLTIAGWSGDRVVVSGYAEVVEAGGTCQATLTRPGAADVVVEAPAVADVATTSCSLEVPGDRLAAGAWTVTLRYVSAAYAGASAASALEVPA